MYEITYKLTTQYRFLLHEEFVVRLLNKVMYTGIFKRSV